MADSSFFKDGGAGTGTFASIDVKIAEAEAAKVAAEAAQAAAEAAQATVSSNTAAAAASQVAAAASETNAAASAASSSTNATSASNSAADAQKLAINAEDTAFTLTDGTSGLSALHYKEKASDSATAAAASASTASSHASTASGHASTASTKAGEAAVSAGNAATSETNAAASASAAASSAANFTPAAIENNSGTPVLASGITDAEVRTLIGAGTSSFDGAYGSLTGTPTIPTNNNQLTNGAGYITSVPAQSFASLTGKPTTISGYGITDAFDGAYSSLTGTPTIPTNNNQLTNGAGYITSADGGNAATLDGIDSSSFLRSDADDTMTGDLTISSGSNSAPVHVYTQLEIESASHSAIQFSGSTNAEQWIWFADDSSSTPVGGITYNHNTPNMGFRVEGAERARFDSLGRYIIGKTTAGLGTAGHTFDPSGYYYQTRAGDLQFLNRTGSDGVHTYFYKDGASKGNIGTYGDKLQIGQGNANVQFSNADDAIIPANANGTVNDNALDLGTSSARFNDIHAGGKIFSGEMEATSTNLSTVKITGYTANSGLPMYSYNDAGGCGWATGDPDSQGQGYANLMYLRDTDNSFSVYLGQSGAATHRLKLESNGDLHVDGNVTAYSTTVSDIRLKKDIAPIEDAVTKVQQLNGCTFTYLKDDRKSAGLIAQDLEKVLPSAVIEDEAVFHGEEGETYKTVQYDQVIGLLVEAVKELKAEIEELKKG